MAEASVIFERVPTYFVSYSGTLAIGSIFVIPNKHRREGDRGNNDQVRVVIQNDLQQVGTGIYAHPPLLVEDNSNADCASIWVPSAWQLETPETLKIKCGPDAFGSGLTGAFYKIIVFYRKPE